MPLNDLSVTGLNAPALRLTVFAGAFALFSVLETLFPRRPHRLQQRIARWPTHFALVIFATVFLRGLTMAFPLLALSSASAFALESQWGIFNNLGLPIWIELLAAIVLLDLVVWLQHIISHRVPILWRIHRVHHADLDIDASTAIRFHPVEIALSAVYKLFFVLLLGPSILSVILFEILLNASAMFNHANLKLPKWLDASLRIIVVTPDMHRVHHSTRRDEHNANFGFGLSIWDHAFRTYTHAPKDGHADMTIGLKQHQNDQTKNLGWALRLPFRK